MQYRTRLQIVAEILAVASDGAKKTHIMHQANLSYTQLCRYLGDVVSCGLVQMAADDRYVVAPKGKEFLTRYATYQELRTQLNEELTTVVQERSHLEQMVTTVRAG